jgi:hypothetical protein
MLLVVVVLAVAFDSINGFHDTANAIATSVATRALRPQRRSSWRPRSASSGPSPGPPSPRRSAPGLCKTMEEAILARS